ncbi:transglycosylase SLT domain-containing protein [Marinicella sp. S1101]|uniref:lytic transglycosylase n=1 Tax=Marinicella marina TaxID=2996016 RepID=UPI002260D16E|nr:transglycosylase SLT domain-containing protein [Marinicella marina]MCX7552945.1 transglycosylase SLT domain-containing protein [Marinicella marina]MDJ1139745.1 transglycosylase SLT domain-containing protein [Marinicella marina]
MRLIFIFFLLMTFSACQKQTVKPEPVSTPTPLATEDLILGIERCQKDEGCLQHLNQYFSDLARQSKIEQELTDDLPPEANESNNTDPLAVKQPNNENLEIITDQPNIDLNIPLLNNTKVQAALNEWLTWKRPKLIETWQNYQFLKNKIWPPFADKKIPESLLLAIITQESGGRVHSMSSAGASGLFQFMPATAKRFGVIGTIGDYDARYHPETAAVGAAKYIQEQQGKYGNDYAKILAAYNAGENRFRRLNKKHNNQSIWDSQFFYDLPSETQHYIGTVLSAMLIYENPEAFNVVLNKSDGSTALVRVNSDTSLSELAVCFGQFNNEMGWYRILRNLNASVKAKRVIKQNAVVVIPAELKSVYDNKCNNSDLMKLAKTIHDADFPDRPAFTWYKIRKGDSLSTISRKFRCSTRKEIAQLNNIKGPRYLINAGKKLKVPRC